MRIRFLLIFHLLFFVARSQTFELVSSDTVNLIDVNKKKQGPWIIRGKNIPVKSYDGCFFQPNQKVEEGWYKDNRKTGSWTTYYCNSNVKNRITFKDGRPDGPAKMYYENGQLDEEGVWRNNRWVGQYKKYSENGKLIESVTFDENGKKVSFSPDKK
jgi:hypothetical protein